MLRFMCYLAYNSLLELSFAMDEFALPPPTAGVMDFLLGCATSNESKAAGCSQGKKDDCIDGRSGQQDENCVTSVCEQHASICTASPQDSLDVMNADIDSDGEFMDCSDVEVTQFQDATEFIHSGNIADREICHMTLKTTEDLLNTLSTRRVSGVQTNRCAALAEETNEWRTTWHIGNCLGRKRRNSQWFRGKVDHMVFSSSPYIMYSVPYLESEQAASNSLEHYLPEKLYWSPSLAERSLQNSEEIGGQDTGDHPCCFLAKSVTIMEVHPFVLNAMVSPANDVSVQVSVNMHMCCTFLLCMEYCYIDFLTLSL